MIRDRILDIPIAVIVRDGMVLISKRRVGDSFGGFWEFPGGKLEVGETLEQGLIREIQEELGISISVSGKRMMVEHPYPNRTIRLHCFNCRVIQGEPRAIECADWKWIYPGELGGYSFPPASLSLVESLMKTLE